jgi:hypothetical protein
VNKTLSGILQLARLLLDSLPGLLYVARLRVGLAYAESERQFAI